MALNKLHYCYGIDTNNLFTAEEKALETAIIRAKKMKSKIKGKMKFFAGSEPLTDFYAEKIKFINRYLSDRKEKLKEMISQNMNSVRILDDSKLTDKKKISLFDSSLTRCFGLSENEMNTDIMVVRVYYFGVAENIIKNGFLYNGKKYVFFSSSAGQIRTKKMVCVREDLLKKHWNTLTCGLTVDKINQQGGMNINKYLAYLALCNSATDEWADFDIDRVIVVEDFETAVNSEVDYIDGKTYGIEKKNMPVPIPHTDGCGMILPTVSNKNFMIRLPFVKGLLGVFDFRKFVEMNDCSPIVVDIYGDKHDIIKENIQIILTKSQFKMWKFYSDWNEYKNKFKKYGCQAGTCNVEVDKFTKANINYQMIQSLVDITDDELKQLCSASNRFITDIANNPKAMLKAFGATETNPSKNLFQKCLLKYPELLADVYCRKSLKDLKNSLEKDLWSAKFEVDGYYTFILPDLYAFCEWLFLGVQNPVGLLANGEVHCKLFDYGKKVDCLRSPHLYQEHAVRENITSNKIAEWFISNALYTSTHDVITKILQCDCDGDTSLVIKNELLIKIAERNMNGIVPLYYEMHKANAEKITPDNLYKGLSMAFTGGNIGIYSNDISKIKNSPEIIQQGNDGEAMKCIKWLCLQNNETIDYAKTLYKSIPPKQVKQTIQKYTNRKLPHFFIYAKDKEENQVEEINNSPVNRLKPLFPTKKLDFNFNAERLGKFDYKVLMADVDVEINVEIVEKFCDLTKNIKSTVTEYDKNGNYSAILNDVKKEMLKTGYDEKYICDVLVKHLFHEVKSVNKRTFWSIYGSIVYENICRNLADNLVICQRCNKRFYNETAENCHCDKCKKYYDRLQRNNQKAIVCVDCGSEVVVSMKNNQSCRCKKCYEIYRRKQKTEWDKKKRTEQNQKITPKK